MYFKSIRYTFSNSSPAASKIPKHSSSQLTKTIIYFKSNLLFSYFSRLLPLKDSCKRTSACCSFFFSKAWLMRSSTSPNFPKSRLSKFGIILRICLKCGI